MTTTAPAAHVLRHDSETSAGWQQQRDEEARRALGALAEVGRARAVLDRLLVQDVVEAPRECGTRWFRRETNQPGGEPVVGWSTTPRGPLTVLADPAKLTADAGRPVAVDLAEPSPDGRLLLLGTSEAGLERTRLQIVDVETGQPLPDHVHDAALPLATWLPNSSGFHFASRNGTETPLHLHRIGVGAFDERLPAPVRFPSIRGSASSPWAVVLDGNGQITTPYARTPDGDWIPFLHQVPGAHWGTPHGEDYIAVVDDGAPRGRLVRIPFASVQDTAAWQVLLDESDDVLRGVCVVDDVLVVTVIRDCAVELLLLDPKRGTCDRVPLPEKGVACSIAAPVSYPLVPAVVAGDGAFTFLHSTLRTSWAPYRYDVRTAALEQLAPPAVEVLAEVGSAMALSADGTPVPYDVMRLDGTPRPALLSAYGGFGLALLPGWQPQLAAWVELGGTVVLGHLRGGGELGSQWWEAGRRERKANSWDDAVAIAEAVRFDGTATTVAVHGASNGGLLAGALLTRRPDLWSAVVSEVPILDLVGFADDPVTLAIGEREYGDPRIADNRQWLERLSPMHNIADGVAYPPLLLIAGANDPRCPAWHARAFAARIAEATASDNPVLLRVINDAGHGAALRDDKLAVTSQWLGFAAAFSGLVPA
jgi:prolyl oligopeptidase